MPFLGASECLFTVWIGWLDGRLREGSEGSASKALEVGTGARWSSGSGVVVFNRPSGPRDPRSVIDFGRSDKGHARMSGELGAASGCAWVPHAGACGRSHGRASPTPHDRTTSETLEGGITPGSADALISGALFVS